MELVADSLAELISHYLARSLCGAITTDLTIYDRFEVNTAIGYMSSHMAEKLTVKELANQVNLFSGHFTHIFHEVTGHGPIEYLNLLRLDQAKKLLKKS